jgi:hypothetical protein
MFSSQAPPLLCTLALCDFLRRTRVGEVGNTEQTPSPKKAPLLLPTHIPLLPCAPCLLTATTLSPGSTRAKLSSGQPCSMRRKATPSTRPRWVEWRK